jgi:hypothetical protein
MRNRKPRKREPRGIEREGHLDEPYYFDFSGISDLSDYYSEDELAADPELAAAITYLSLTPRQRHLLRLGIDPDTFTIDLGFSREEFRIL